MRWLSALIEEIRSIYDERAIKSTTPNYPRRLPGGARVFLVKGHTVYMNASGPEASNCMFIRCQYRGRWYKVNERLEPIGSSYPRHVVDSWVKVTEILSQ